MAGTVALGCAASPPDPPDAEPSPAEQPLRIPPLSDCDPDAPARPVRVATWNIGATRQSSIAAVIDVLAGLDADLVLVQEIEAGAQRTDEIDQPAAIAEALGYAYAFAVALQFDGGDFGLAVFSRLPFAEVDRIELDSSAAYEPRIALDVTVCAGAMPLRAVDVHADFMPQANSDNLGELSATLGSLRGPGLLAGDFNATPQAQSVQGVLATTHTIDVFADRDPRATRAGERIDFVFATEDLDAAVTDADRHKTDASDHAALTVDFGF